MPSSLPRISICISPEQGRLLARLSELQGRSQASYVRHLVDIATPHLAALLRPLERVSSTEAALDDRVSDALDQLMDEADEQLDLLVSLDLEGVAGADAGERSQAAAASATTPRTVTTGVKV